MPRRRLLPLAALGSKRLRGLFVLFLALLVCAPLLYLWPWLCLGTAVLWLGLFLTPLPRCWLRRLEEDRPVLTPRAVAVLGGGFAEGCALSSRSLRRLHHGIRLAREHGVPLILCGGALSGGVTEAGAMAQAARELGYSGALELEQGSHTTLENLCALREFLGAGGDAPLWALTCPHHLPRVLRLSRLLCVDLVPITYPAAQLPGGAAASVALAAECAYECAIHVWLSLRSCLVLVGLRRPIARR